MKKIIVAVALMLAGCAQDLGVHYDDAYRVTKGFYAGCHGKVKSAYWSFPSTTVKLNLYCELSSPGERWFEIDELEKI